MINSSVLTQELTEIFARAAIMMFEDPKWHTLTRGVSNQVEVQSHILHVLDQIAMSMSSSICSRIITERPDLRSKIDLMVCGMFRNEVFKDALYEDTDNDR